MAARMKNHRIRLGLNRLEERTVPTGWVATAADAGGSPHVIIRTDTNNDGQVDTVASSFFAFDPNFRGGVRVAVGNFNSDGYNELVTVAGPGGTPLVRIWTIDKDGRVLGLQEEFVAFSANFRGGCFVTTGDFNGPPGTAVDTGTGIAVQNRTLVVSAGEGGGPHVKVFKDTDGDGYVSDNLIDEFFAFDAGFRGGVRVGVGHFYSGTPHGEPGTFVAQYISDFNYLICAAGPGGGPHVKVYNSFGEFDQTPKISDNGIVDEFFAFDPGFRGGVFVGASNLSTGNSQVDNLVVSGGGTVDIYRMSVATTSNGTLTGVSRYGVPKTLAHTRLHSFKPRAGYTGDVHLNKVRLRFNYYESDLMTSFGLGAGATIITWSGAGGDGQVSLLPKVHEYAAFVAANGTPYAVGVWAVQGY